MDWLLEIALIAILVATLFHVLRLERALGVLRRDRTALAALVTEFNASAQTAEQSIVHLKVTADSTGRQIASQVEAALRLKDDLEFLAQTGGRIADRLEAGLRESRKLDRTSDLPERPERDNSLDRTAFPSTERASLQEVSEAPRPRSRAEQDLMRALRLVR